MKNKLLFSTISIVLCLTSCADKKSDDLGATGSISLKIEMDIKVNEIQGRISAVSADTLNVDLFQMDGTLTESYENVIDFPAVLELLPGEYYVEVYSDNQHPAAWENPYVYGHSGNFTVESGVNHSISVECSIQNCKVTVDYTLPVTENFDSYQTVISNSQSSLTFNSDEVRSGYFDPDTLRVLSSLTFLTTDGTSIEKSFSGLILDAQPGYHYEVLIDANPPVGQANIQVTINEDMVKESVQFSDEPSIVDGAIPYGALLITEIMYNPSELSDTDGEWFEIYNNGGEAFDIYNLVIRKGDEVAFIHDQAISLNAGEYMIFGRTSSATTEVDYVYGNALNLTNSGDRIVLTNYGSDGSNGSVISEIDYGNGTGFPTANGASINLDPAFYNVELAKVGSNWCLSTESFETNDLGTPGLLNSSCN